jgi:hypothetical protein
MRECAMSLTLTVDHARRRVFTRATGDVTLEQVLAHIREEQNAAGLGYSEVIDARGFRPELTSADVRIIVDTLHQLSKQTSLGPTAVIVDSDVGFGMMRMLQILMEDVAALRPFRQESEATEWLNAMS